MSLELIEEEVDIDAFPNVDSRHPVIDGEFTIGDLHGNAMKFLFMLIKQGVVSNISKQEYDTLRGIYTKSTSQLTKEDLTIFQEIIDKMAVEKNCLVRLIGDELGDRGKNDYFTLLLLNKLHKEKLPMEIVLSNHGVEFIKRFANTDNFSPSIRVDQIVSLVNINTLIKKGLIEENEIKKITTEAYKPYLKAITYSLSEDKTEISIFSHAPIGIATIEKLAASFNVPFVADSAEKLAQTIDAINVKFKEEVDVNIISKRINDPQSVLSYTIWNRVENISRNSQYNGYSVNYIHGHTGDQGYYQSKKHIINLNNTLGQLPQMGDNKGSYGIIYSNSTKNLVDKLLARISDDSLKQNIQSLYTSYNSGQINEISFKKSVAKHLAKPYEMEDAPHLYELTMLLLVEPIHRKLFLEIKNSNENLYQLILIQYISKYSKEPIDDTTFKAEVFKIIQSALADSPKNTELKEKLNKFIEDVVVEDKYQQAFRKLKAREPAIYTQIFDLYKQKFSEKSPIDDATFKARSLDVLVTQLVSVEDLEDKKQMRKLCLDFIRDEDKEFKDALKEILNCSAPLKNRTT